MSLATTFPRINRREGLAYIFMVSLLVLLLQLLGVSTLFAWPKTDYLTIGPVTDYPPRDTPYLIHINQATSPFWLVNLGSEIRIFVPNSPDALHCRYAWVEVTIRFEDPCSGSTFALDGTYRGGPAYRGLDQYPFSIQQGQIQIDPTGRIPGPFRGEDPQENNSAVCGNRIFHFSHQPKIREQVPGIIISQEPLRCP